MNPYNSDTTIRFLLELQVRGKWNPYLSIASSIVHSNFIISKFDIIDYPENSYWKEWGGTYDSPIRHDISLFLDHFYLEVYSLELLSVTRNSFYETSNSIYICSEIYPWQQYRTICYISDILGFSSTIRDPNFPSDDTYSGVSYPPRLIVPTIGQIAIPDPINGIIPLSTFSVNLHNEDGFFDTFDIISLFNTPIKLKKSTVQNPSLNDFVTIKMGYVEDQSITFESFTIKAADPIRSFTMDTCRTITKALYPSVIDDSIDKPLPIAYGKIIGAPVITITKEPYAYVVCDSDYFTGIDAAYDNKGEQVQFLLNNGLITSAVEISTVDFLGKQIRTIGEIIVSEVTQKCNIPYEDHFWDVLETDHYRYESPSVGFFFASGTVQQMIADVLKTDTAFFFTKNDGRMSIRRWGKTYNSTVIENWIITKTPQKSYSDQKYFCSSVSVGFQYDYKSKKNLNQTLNDTKEYEIYSLYSKTQRLKYETKLEKESDSIALANLLLTRQSARVEIEMVSVGCDTSMINILDEIVLYLVINGRIFSNISRWIVRSIDPAQDRIELEEARYIDQVNAGTMVEPSVYGLSGISSYPSVKGISGEMSNPLIISEK